MIYIGTQYYRPPFPNQKYWQDDFRRIKDSGLNTVQLWVLWSWVEATPGTFVFDDYDRLIELAAENELQVVLSTIAELQPYWIHDEIPDSEMITASGRKVVSGNRQEAHFGLSPGACTDHPEVWRRMSLFLDAVGRRYADTPHLAGWDIWNELRWDVHAPENVCHCGHTLTAFRSWLQSRYGDLDGLNAAWQRRYSKWSEVRPAISMEGRPYTEAMAWFHFTTWRASEHGCKRYELMRRIDARRPITLHGSDPTPHYGGGNNQITTPLNRGNDWDFADHVDGIGLSSFPKWFHMSDMNFARRLEYVRSAARSKRIWLSELQGGRSAQGLDIHDPVDAHSQQRWLWSGLSLKADTILFWCWRDEVFCTEAGGYGLAGADGLAEERLAALRHTGDVVRRHQDLLESYQPAQAICGALFSPQSYYYYAAQETQAARPRRALDGVCAAYLRLGIPYRVVEDNHLSDLEGLRLLYLPRATALTASARAALLDFVREGGTLVAEAECGAFDETGIYQYPEHRFLATEAELCEVGRRQLDGDSFRASFAGRSLELPATQWKTPLAVSPQLEVHAQDAEGALLASASLGKGRIVYCASYPSEAYEVGGGDGFEQWIESMAHAVGWRREVEVIPCGGETDRPVHLSHGQSDGRKVLFLFFADGCHRAFLRFDADFLPAGTPLTDLLTDRTYTPEQTASGRIEVEVEAPSWPVVVLVASE